MWPIWRLFFEKEAWPNSFSSLSTKRTINFENLFSLDVVHCIYCVSCKQLSFCQLELPLQQPLWFIAAIFRALCFVVSFWFYSDLFKAKCFWKVKNTSWTIYQLVKIQSDSFIPRTAGYFPQIYGRTGPGGGIHWTPPQDFLKCLELAHIYPNFLVLMV